MPNSASSQAVGVRTMAPTRRGTTVRHGERRRYPDIGIVAGAATWTIVGMVGTHQAATSGGRRRFEGAMLRREP